MREADKNLLKMAGEVSDEVPVDWSAVTSDPDYEGVPVRGLELIARVAAVHRRHNPSPDPQAVLFCWGPLQVTQELGRGTYGTVYRAWDQRLQTEVALKLRTDTAEAGARAWLEEARRLARVKHPNVVRVLGADVHDDRVGLWMELLEGPTLAEFIAPGERLSYRETGLIGLDLCSALSAVHAAGLVHGDIKPQNVVKTADGRCVLLDFGSGRELNAPAAAQTSTPIFAAPELVAGQSASIASDVYALGAVLFRLVTGQALVQASSWDELREAHRTGQVPSLRTLRPDLPAPFVAAVDQALRPDPGNRHADLAAFERALYAGLGERPAAPKRWRIFLAAAVLLVALISAWQFPLRSRPRPDAPWTATGPGQTTIAAEANFFRADGGSREPLDNGSRIAPGEQLRLEFTANRDLHLYILNEDVGGELYLLFPLPGLQAANPLAAEERHRLPGLIDGREQDWVVTSAGGRERFLVVGSTEPLPEFEQVLASIPAADPGRAVSYPLLSAAHFTTLRGVGGLNPRTGKTGAWQDSRLAELARMLEQGTAPHGSLWYRQIEFLNPRP